MINWVFSFNEHNGGEQGNAGCRMPKCLLVSLPVTRCKELGSQKILVFDVVEDSVWGDEEGEINQRAGSQTGFCLTTNVARIWFNLNLADGRSYARIRGPGI